MFTAGFYLITLANIILQSCGYVLRGGTTQIAGGKLPAKRFLGDALCTFGFVAWAFYLVGYSASFATLALVLAAIYYAGWYFTIAFAWQPYYSIGQSLQPRRAGVAWIDWFLSKTWGNYVLISNESTGNKTVLAPGKNPTWWRIGRDGTGMFLRMMYSLPLFFALGAFLDPKWYIGLLALQFASVFALGTVFIYGIYNWFVPSSWREDNDLNLSEVATGAWLGGLAMYLYWTLL